MYNIIQLPAIEMFWDLLLELVYKPCTSSEQSWLCWHSLNLCGFMIIVLLHVLHSVHLKLWMSPVTMFFQCNPQKKRLL